MFGVFGVALCALAATTETFEYGGKSADYKHVCGHLDSAHLVSPARIGFCLSPLFLIGFGFCKECFRRHSFVLHLRPLVVLPRGIIRVWALIPETGQVQRVAIWRYRRPVRFYRRPPLWFLRLIRTDCTVYFRLVSRFFGQFHK